LKDNQDKYQRIQEDIDVEELENTKIDKKEYKKGIEHFIE
tara:strand:+ start:235 stop:354 length:120 start_codon:yes stop_codon:yes gene_type:complete